MKLGHFSRRDFVNLETNSIAGIEPDCSFPTDEYIKYIFLDSSANTIGNIQLPWLERELKGARKVALFFYHPILGIDTPLE